MTLVLPCAVIVLQALISCRASPPTHVEKKIVQEGKDLVIGGKDWRNPLSNDAASSKAGAEKFQRYCLTCHGPDGHTTGIPFASKMSPPVPDLGATDIQKYTDGQLKWVIENGIRMSGMPGWKGLLQDNDMWQMVSYIRHLPPTGNRAPEVSGRAAPSHGENHTAR